VNHGSETPSRHLYADDDDVVAEAVAIARRQVAVDSSVDLVAFGADGDALDDFERAVGADVYIDDVLEDALACLRQRDGCGRDQAQGDGQCAQRSAHDMRTGTAARCSLSAW
jgi:hypothetical protein